METVSCRSGTVGETTDRRARKKALTRAQIVRVAHALFGEHGFDSVTIADVAAAADVAVQTVFNHFGSKEELFFDGRTPWLSGAADALRDRPPHVDPLTVLHAFSTRLVRSLLDAARSGEQRIVAESLAASPSLARYHLSLQHKAEDLLADALLDAWSTDPSTAPSRGAAGEVELRLTAALVASLFAGSVRAVLRAARGVAGDDVEHVHAAVQRLAGLVFDRLEHGLGPTLRHQEPVGRHAPADRLSA